METVQTAESHLCFSQLSLATLGSARHRGVAKQCGCHTISRTLAPHVGIELLGVPVCLCVSESFVIKSGR